MVNWPIFSDRHRSTAIPNFRLRKREKLLECHFNTSADSWSYRSIFGVARAFQNLRKFAFSYGKIVGKCSGWESAGESARDGKVLGNF